MYSGIFLRENEFCGLVSVSENIFGKSIVMWHVDELDCGDGTVQSVLPPPNSGAANKAVKVIQHMDREDCLPLVASYPGHFLLLTRSYNSIIHVNLLVYIIALNHGLQHIAFAHIP